MLDAPHTQPLEETRIEYLQRNLREVRGAMNDEIYRSRAGIPTERHGELKKLERSMQAELDAIAPYQVQANGPLFCVVHDGDFIRWEPTGEFRWFLRREDAEAWIDENSNAMSEAA